MQHKTFSLFKKLFKKSLEYTQLIFQHADTVFFKYVEKHYDELLKVQNNLRFYLTNA